MEEILNVLDGLQVVNIENTATVERLLHAFGKVITQNPDLVKEAENQVKIWETEPGFYSMLLNIAFDQNIDLNFRWLAILCFKNGIDKHWESVIADDEKSAICHKLLSNLSEPNNQIALQLPVIIAKVAFYHISKWQELFPTLINGLQSTEEVHLRSLLLLSNVVKISIPKYPFALAFAIGDLPVLYQQASQTLFPIILDQWIHSSALFLEALQTNVAIASPLLESAVLSLKMLKHLVLGYKDIPNESKVTKFLDLIFKQFKPFLESRLASMNVENIREKCEKYLVLLVKVLIKVSTLRRDEFTPFIPLTLECGVTHCFNNDFQSYMFEDLIVKFMNLLTGISEKRKYEFYINPEMQRKENIITDEKNKPLVLFYTDSVINEIFRQLVSKYLPLTEKELSCWKNDPEEFFLQDGFMMKHADLKKHYISNNEDSLRAAAENYFRQLAKSFHDIMSPLVFEFIKVIEVNDNCAIDVLKKDTVYLVLGLAAYDLCYVQKYRELFTSVLLPDLDNKSKDYYIIRRRVAWLIGHCCGKVNLGQLLMISKLVQCMVKEEDLVVRLTAVHSLENVLCEGIIQDEDFLPVAKDTFSALLSMLLEVEELQLKSLILSTINFILRKEFKLDKLPLIDLIDYLQGLWNQCGNNNLLRCLIMQSFAQLCQNFKQESERLHPFLLPIITMSVDLSQPFHVYFLEYGLDLLYSVLKFAVRCSNELLNVAINVLSILESNNEYFLISLHIIEAYILLVPTEFLTKYGDYFIKICTSLVRNIEPEKVNQLLSVVEHIFVLFNSVAVEQFESLLDILLNITLGTAKIPFQFESITFSLLSYTVLYNPKVFVNILRKKADVTEKNDNVILDELLNVLMLRIKWNRNQKIIGIALCTLLPSGFQVVNDRFADILQEIVEVLDSLAEYSSDLKKDSMVKYEPPTKKFQEIVYGDLFYTSCHEERKNYVDAFNPVYFLNLHEYFYAQLKELEQIVGTSNFEKLMAGVDDKVKEQIKKYTEA